MDINENNIGSLKYIDTDEFYFKVKSILNIKDAGILKKNKELYFSNGIHTFDLRQNRVSNDLKEEKDLDNTMVYIEDDGDTKKIYIRSNGKRKKITYTEDEIISCGLIKEDIVYIIKKDDDKIQGSLIDVDTLEKKNIIFPFKDVKDVEIDSDMNFIASKIDRLFIGKLCPVSELKYKGLTDELLFNRIVELISEKEEFEHGIRIIRNRKTETIEVDFNSQSHLLSQIIKQHIDIMFYLYMTMSGKYRDHGIIITTCHFKEKIMTTTDMNLIKNVYYSRNSDTLNRSVMITVNDNNIRFKGGI